MSMEERELVQLSTFRRLGADGGLSMIRDLFLGVQFLPCSAVKASYLQSDVRKVYTKTKKEEEFELSLLCSAENDVFITVLLNKKD